MIRLFFLFLAGYCVYLIFKGAIRKSAQIRPPGKPAGETTHRDPVCGMYVTEDDAVVGRLDDRKLYFCSMECLEKYRENLVDK